MFLMTKIVPAVVELPCPSGNNLQLISLAYGSNDRMIVCVILVEGQKVRPSRILVDQVSESFKKTIINAARSWPVYFSRIFPVSVRSFYLPHNTYMSMSWYTNNSMVCLKVKISNKLDFRVSTLLSTNFRLYCEKELSYHSSLVLVVYVTS